MAIRLLQSWLEYLECIAFFASFHFLREFVFEVRQLRRVTNRVDLAKVGSHGRHEFDWLIVVIKDVMISCTGARTEWYFAIYIRAIRESGGAPRFL